MSIVQKIIALVRSMSSENLRFVGTISLALLALVAIAVGLSMVPLPSERLFISHSGYTVRYPADWIVGDVRRDSSYESELIREPNGRATIAVSVHQEPRLQERGGRAAVAREIELGFTRDKNYRLNFFGWITPEVGAEYNGYVATGFFDNGSGQYAFREIGVLDPAGSKVTFRTEVLAAFVEKLGPVVDAALLSVRSDWTQQILKRGYGSTLITADEAKGFVERLPDFALYRDAALEQGAVYILEAEDSGVLWKVRMYVGGANGGTLVKIPIESWRVDKTTGAISKVVP